MKARRIKARAIARQLARPFWCKPFNLRAYSWESFPPTRLFDFISELEGLVDGLCGLPIHRAAQP